EKIREQVKRNYRRRMQGENVPAPYELELTGKDGKPIMIEVSGRLISYKGRPADLATVRDIRERKKLEEQRLRLEKLAAIGEMATMVGHDLRNPLQSIANAAYYLNNELPHLSSSAPMPNKVMEMISLINESVNYADGIIRDLRDFSATRQPMLEKADINAIVKAAIRQLEVPENVGIVIELGRLPEIGVDIDMMKRVFMNLARNGIQAIENGGILKVSTKKAKRFVEINFGDTGTGISKENMEKLFTPFFTTKAKGMGMGLAVCKRFVDAHGGSIDVESKEGKGSTFTVRLHVLR
ncbi:MAG: PAS domain S-box protein, partial [Candidatus Bathyarchaeota archaeon]